MTNEYVEKFRNAPENETGEKVDEHGQRLPDPGSQMGLSRMPEFERTQYLRAREEQRLQSIRDWPWAF